MPPELKILILYFFNIFKTSGTSLKGERGLRPAIINLSSNIFFKFPLYFFGFINYTSRNCNTKII